MKKTLIALTLAALPVAAMADVTLYGQIKGGLEFTKTKGIKNTVSNINDWGSRIGFKGEEDLGNGLKTIWQVEQRVSLDRQARSNTRWADRDSYIGLATPFGTLRAGNLSDAFNNDMGDLNPWEGNGVRVLNTWGRVENRYTAVRYDSPEVAGFQANVLYSPEDNGRYDQARAKGVPDLDGFEGVTGVVNTVSTNRAVTTVGLTYNVSGFFAKYGFGYQLNRAAANENGQVHRVMGGYNANNIFAGLGFQYTKNWDAAKVDTKEIALTAAYTLGNITPRASLAYGFKNKANGNTVNDSQYLQAIVGADYDLSKRTTALVSVGWMKQGVNSTADVVAPQAGKTSNQAYSVGLGLRHRF